MDDNNLYRKSFNYELLKYLFTIILNITKYYKIFKIPHYKYDININILTFIEYDHELYHIYSVSYSLSLFLLLQYFFYSLPHSYYITIGK